MAIVLGGKSSAAHWDTLPGSNVGVNRAEDNPIPDAPLEHMDATEWRGFPWSVSIHLNGRHVMLQYGWPHLALVITGQLHKSWDKIHGEITPLIIQVL